jgi:hypothetical protein
MTQLEIIQAILADKALDIKWRDSEWYAFCPSTSNIDWWIMIKIIDTKLHKSVVKEVV